MHGDGAEAAAVPLLHCQCIEWQRRAGSPLSHPIEKHGKEPRIEKHGKKTSGAAKEGSGCAAACLRQGFPAWTCPASRCSDGLSTQDDDAPTLAVPSPVLSVSSSTRQLLLACVGKGKARQLLATCILRRSASSFRLPLLLLGNTFHLPASSGIGIRVSTRRPAAQELCVCQTGQAARPRSEPDSPEHIKTLSPCSARSFVWHHLGSANTQRETISSSCVFLFAIPHTPFWCCSVCVRRHSRLPFASPRTQRLENAAPSVCVHCQVSIWMCVI